MKTLVAYILIICLFIWQAIRNGGEWWHGVVVFFGMVIFVAIGNGISSLFDDIVFRDAPAAPRVKKQPRYAQKLLKDDSPNHPSSRQVVVYQGEVVEDETDYPQLTNINPLPPSRRIANVKTYKEGDGGFFAAMPMWCDKCRHYPIHFHIDGAWVCQCPWHKD